MPPICGDISNQLFNEKGTLFCSPDRGITGRGAARCPTFYRLKRHAQIVWKDGRKRLAMTTSK